MASFKKFQRNAVSNILRHCNREVKNPSNKDINPELSCKNYSLLQKRELSDYDYFKSIINAEDISYWNRSDTVAMVGVVISYPVSITEEEDEFNFFKACVEFLNERYNERFAVQAIVHVDESQNKSSVKGRHHLHYNFVPCVPNENKRRNKKWQVCCSKLLTPMELKTFHPDLQCYLLQKGINEYVVSKVKYGVVKNNGRNYSVKQIKAGVYDRHLRERKNKT